MQDEVEASPERVQPDIYEKPPFLRCDSDLIVLVEFLELPISGSDFGWSV
jgi:hypothetical protein